MKVILNNSEMVFKSKTVIRDRVKYEIVQGTGYNQPTIPLRMSIPAGKDITVSTEPWSYETDYNGSMKVTLVSDGVKRDSFSLVPSINSHTFSAVDYEVQGININTNREGAKREFAKNFYVEW